MDSRLPAHIAFRTLPATSAQDTQVVKGWTLSLFPDGGELGAAVRLDCLPACLPPSFEDRWA